MKLHSYLKLRRLTVPAFAAVLGETENVVRKWVYGQRQPSLPNALKIELATNGAVTPRDLLLSEPSGTEAE